MSNLVQKFLEARLIGGNSEFVANVEKAENMVWEATDHDVRDKYQIKVGSIKNGAGKYSTVDKSITIDVENCAQKNIDVACVIVHELLHAIEQEQFPTLAMKETFEFMSYIREMEPTHAKEIARELFNFIRPENLVSKELSSIADELDDILDNLEAELKPVAKLPKTKAFIRWYLDNTDKIQNTVIFNATGGHTPEWVDMKNQVEKLFKVTIPVAID